MPTSLHWPGGTGFRLTRFEPLSLPPARTWGHWERGPQTTAHRVPSQRNR